MTAFIEQGHSYTLELTICLRVQPHSSDLNNCLGAVHSFIQGADIENMTGKSGNNELNEARTLQIQIDSMTQEILPRNAS
jgi:hypothetical protein